MENISRIIGNNIRVQRKLRNMTREQLAEALDLDTAYLGQCERGERQLGLTKTIEIINFFGITANDIISINTNKETANKEIYIKESNSILKECSDNQLLAILHCVTPLVSFLKE